MKLEWVVDCYDLGISLDKLAGKYSELGQNTYLHFYWCDLDGEVDHYVWEKVLAAGLPCDVDEFYLLVSW